VNPHFVAWVILRSIQLAEILVSLILVAARFVRTYIERTKNVRMF
jgi:hypothetical protein